MNQHEKLDIVIEQNTYILGLLENNEKTGQEGAIKRLGNLEDKVENMETKDKVRVGKATILGGVAGGAFVFVGKMILKLMF
jgi:hypothetical protein